MTTTAEHAPLRHLAERYWVESRRPLASLVFIAPLLVAYEAGAAWLGAQNGADAFMRWLLHLLGFGQYLLLPALTVCILLAWNHLARQPWRLSGGVLSGMAAESLLLGVCLCLVYLAWGAMASADNGGKSGAHAQMTSASLPGVARPERAWESPEFSSASATPFQGVPPQGVPPAAETGGKIKQSAGAMVGLLGAGIYEELLFRLILLSLLAWGLRRTGVAPRVSTLLAVLASSLLFAAAHHFGQYGEEFVRSRFLFRSLAGVFFSAVFIYRGFGIAAGSHAAYDVLVSVFYAHGSRRALVGVAVQLPPQRSRRAAAIRAR